MFAVIHIADFALQALLRTEPAARDKPAALLDPAQRPPRIVACTGRARACGVELGQTSTQALARHEKLRLLTPRADAETEAAAVLLAIAFTVSPFVETTAPGVGTLRIDGLPAARRELALRDALARLSALGLPATAGAGPTPLLALYAARHTDSLLLIDDGREFLSPLPLSVAEPPPALATILAGWGLRTLGDLVDLPKASVAQRLGPEGLALWERASGETSRPLRLVVPPPAFSASMDCEHEMETLEPVLFLLRRFVDRLAVELQTAALAAAELSLTLKLADATTLVRTLRLPEPTTRPDTLFNTLHTFMENVRTTTAIVGVRLDIQPVRAPTRQHGLFDRALRDPHRFAETLARIAAIVGSDRVGTPVLKNTHRPDAFTLAAPASEIAPLAEPRLFAHPAQGLVLRRFRPPQPVVVEFDAGRSVPLVVRSDRLEATVNESTGPWSASGDWWQKDQQWSREEWDVELDALYRLVRHANGDCFLEGQYD